MIHHRTRTIAALTLAAATGECVGDVPITGGGSATDNCTYFNAGINAKASIQQIVTGPDGNLWFTEYFSNAIGRITPDGVVTEFSKGITPGGGPFAITAGPDGNVWFSEVNANNVARVTPDGTITEFGVGGDSLYYIAGIVTGPDGNIWFTNYYGDAIGRISPKGENVTSFGKGVTFQSGPFGIVVGSDGNLWFAEYEIGGIGRITLDGTITEFRGTIPTNAETRRIAAASDNTLWFTYENNVGGIGEITTAGDVTLYNTGSIGFGPADIVVDAGNNIWFSGNSAGDNGVYPQVSLMERSGVTAIDVCATNLATDSKGLAVGPDGNLWFNTYNVIGRLNIRIFKNGFDTAP
jgi:streptogramin lyase